MTEEAAQDGGEQIWLFCTIPTHLVSLIGSGRIRHNFDKKRKVTIELLSTLKEKTCNQINI
jgi:hypothetical protein